jgi:Ring finger domain
MLIYMQTPKFFIGDTAFMNGKQKVEIKTSRWKPTWYGYQYGHTLRVANEENKEFEVKENDLRISPALQPLLKKITDNICAICLESREEGEEMMGYCHWFHSRCIEPWLADNKYQCPVCRLSWL